MTTKKRHLHLAAAATEETPIPHLIDQIARPYIAVAQETHRVHQIEAIVAAMKPKSYQIDSIVTEDRLVVVGPVEEGKKRW